ncbi:MAG TPA: hypothetical protein VJU86_09080 [Pyrinomonadaceae bacterium]|nr:hypothetical protein [Pyrinomonadaceae bacterium]
MIADAAQIRHLTPRFADAVRLRARKRAKLWLHLFLFVLIGCQLALAFGLFDSYRIFIRVASFAISLVALVLIPGRALPHPSIKPAILILAIVTISILHPTTNNLMAGLAQIMMYVAILAPLFWVSRLRLDVNDFKRVVLVLWAFHSLSAGVGVLQVYYPGQFDSNLSSAYSTLDPGYVSSLQITLATGERVFRPMGLTDIPGGAATAGFYAVVFSMGFLLAFQRYWMKALCVVSIMLGMIVIYMSQIRVTLIMTAICMVGYCLMLAWRRRAANVGVLLVSLAVIVYASFMVAATVGGESVGQRLSSLVDDSPTNVYYKNRGIFVEQTITELLPQYPLGAGLGRWGMMSVYFADADPTNAGLYAEIQWTGWLLDGGVLLIMAYALALLVASLSVFKMIRQEKQLPNDLWLWTLLILAYNCGVFAVTFSFPIFMSQSGLEFWFLNAALFSAVRSVTHKPGEVRFRSETLSPRHR